ncbi:MAG: family 20 glycosylhydrolase [Kiritimatiellae bacterium]|nr:family 20 glycosylhydrolase [Kiritimatiellia bacterium]
MKPLDELLPRPKEALASADGSLSTERMPPGGYALRVKGGRAEIAAVDDAGRHHAEATLVQLRLLSGGTPPDCTIRDWPTFPWRGFMHDCGRNFLDVESVKNVIDLMAKYKLNLFHWHLTDYWGWRLESKKYPMLQAPWAFGRQHGMFYTQAQFREVLDYAKVRGITVMPELDVPGHSLAFRRGLGFKFMCEERVKEVVIDLIDELCSLATPEEMPFIHLGTDESRTPEEMVPDSFCPAWAEAVWRNGRTPVGWSPGKNMTLPGGRKSVKMVWNGDERVGSGEKAFDTAYWYFGNYTPFSFLNYALFAKPCRWDIPDADKLGAVIASWHDDMAGNNGGDVLLNNNFALAVVMFSDLQWNGREKNRPEFHFKMPAAGTPEFDEAVRFEKAVAAQRDKALADSPLPFAWVRGTDMRWRLTDGTTGKVLAEDIPGGCVQIHGFSVQGPGDKTAYIRETTGVAVLETWVRSPRDQSVGAWIDFECFGRSGARSSIALESGALAENGEWSASKRAKVEVNGIAIPPPRWRHPGLKFLAAHPEEPTSNNVSETPFSDECCWMRPPAPLRLKAGWNHVKITAPKTFDAWCYGWQTLFTPILGTIDHPREVPELEYSAHPME